MPSLALPLLAAALAAGATEPPPSPPAADALATLTASLERLGAASAVQARLEHRVRFVTSDGAAPPREGAVEGQVSAGPEGLTVRWPRALLDRSAAEDRRSATEAEAPTPTRDAMRTVDPLELGSMLDAATTLRLALVGASVLEDRPDERDGAPARLLVLKLRVDLKKRDRKYVKEAEATMRLWLGADGLPIASDAVATLRGRAFLVISFSSEQRERHRYARVGDRLVALERERDEKSEGGGEKGGRRLVTRLTPVG